MLCAHGPVSEEWNEWVSLFANIYSLQQTDALDSLAFTERTFCAIDALENFDYKPLFMFPVNLGSDLFFSEGTV